MMKTDKWRSIFDSAVHDYIFHKVEEEERELALQPYDFRQQVRCDLIKPFAKKIKKSKAKLAYSRVYHRESVEPPVGHTMSYYEEEVLFCKEGLAREIHNKILGLYNECSRNEQLELEEKKNAKTRKSA